MSLFYSSDCSLIQSKLKNLFQARKSRFVIEQKQFKLEQKVIKYQKMVVTFSSFWDLETFSSPKIDQLGGPLNLKQNLLWIKE